MLLIIGFGIYVIVKKRVFITRNWTLTGSNARNFGIAVVVITIPISLISRALLPYILPEQLVYHPIGGRLAVLAVLAAVLLLLALAFEDEKPAKLNW
jgi:hypothetical protein